MNNNNQSKSPSKKLILLAFFNLWILSFEIISYFKQLQSSCQAISYAAGPGCRYERPAASFGDALGNAFSLPFSIIVSIVCIVLLVRFLRKNPASKWGIIFFMLTSLNVLWLIGLTVGSLLGIKFA